MHRFEKSLVQYLHWNECFSIDIWNVIIVFVRHASHGDQLLTFSGQSCLELKYEDGFLIQAIVIAFMGNKIARNLFRHPNIIWSAAEYEKRRYSTTSINLKVNYTLFSEWTINSMAQFILCRKKYFHSCNQN